jgi:hypothetical protein
MAQFQHLPIYKLAVDLLDLAADLTRNMPRDFKASLGGEIRTEIIRLIVLIGRANASTDPARRAEHIDELLEHLQVAELLLRLAHGKRFISLSQWTRAAELTATIGKQAGGWRKFSRNAAAPAA